MSTQILSIGTAVPPTRLDQSRVRDFFAGQPGVTKLGARLIGAAFDQSAIGSRYSVIGDLGAGSTVFTDDKNVVRELSTGERNAVYRREAPGLFAAAARDALTRADIDPAEITHVVTASCTGFFSPGPDFLLVRELGIPATAARTHIGFMGCSAAFPALRTAVQSCEARPGSTALVVCAELCSLHIRASNDPEQIVAASVFADGAAAAVVSSASHGLRTPVLEVGGFTTAITSEGEGDMDWTIGDQGFEMRLTAEVPRIVGREIAGAVANLLGPDRDPRTEVSAWAVHPGGRSVLDRVQAGLALSDDALSPSRAVLRDYGNMSSATVLFILQRILEDERVGDRARIVSLGFGPGLTVETARFTRCVAAQASPTIARPAGAVPAATAASLSAVGAA